MVPVQPSPDEGEPIGPDTSDAVHLEADDSPRYVVFVRNGVTAHVQSFRSIGPESAFDPESALRDDTGAALVGR